MDHFAAQLSLVSAQLISLMPKQPPRFSKASSRPLVTLLLLILLLLPHNSPPLVVISRLSTLNSHSPLRKLHPEGCGDRVLLLNLVPGQVDERVVRVVSLTADLHEGHSWSVVSCRI
jgi:hypothetical protein